MQAAAVFWDLNACHIGDDNGGVQEAVSIVTQLVEQRHVMASCQLHHSTPLANVTLNEQVTRVVMTSDPQQ